MNFIALLLIIFLVSVTVKTYKNIYSVTTIITLLLGITSMCLFMGLLHYGNDPLWSPLGMGVTKLVYLHLIGTWYLFDIISSTIIIKNFIRYKKINA